MPEFTVHFTQTASTSVTVEADDLEAAIEAAWSQAPSGLCHQCSSSRYGTPGVELAGDWEPESVYDAGGKQVWTEHADTDA